MKGKLAKVLSTLLVLALSVAAVPANGKQVNAATAAVVERAADAPAGSVITAKKETQKENSNYQPKHLLAKAVDIARKAEAGRLKVAVEEITGTDGYYDVLSVEEKKLYDAFGQVYTYFRPFDSSNAYYDKAKSTSDPAEALYEDIQYGNVCHVEFGRDVSKDEAKQMFNMASISYYFDHPYNLLGLNYRMCYYKLGNSMFIAPAHVDNADDFDYNSWGDELIRFEEDALTAIVNDSRFSATSAPIKEYLVHEFICGRVKYDDSKPNEHTLLWSKIKSAYGPMVENSGVCIGIAKMAKILLDDLEVKNYIIHSGTHAWNMVVLDGENYELDCTWDLDYGKGMKYKFFNITTDQLLAFDSDNHHVRAADSARLPIANATKYNYEAVCNLMSVAPAENQSTVENPDYDPDDYTEEEGGELYPNLENYEYDGLIYDLFSEGYAVCKGAKGNPKSLELPDYVVLTDDDGVEYYYSFVMITEGAFAQNNKLKKVVIPGTTVFIDKKAFYKCKNLKSITICGVEDLSEIDSNAFKGIAKKATFTIYADSDEFDLVKAMLKQAGAPKKAKYKRATI